MSRVSYTEKQKADKVAKANAAHDAGKSWDEAAKVAGIARLTLFNWMHPKAKKAAKARKAGRKAGRKPRTIVIYPPLGNDAVVEAALKTPAAQKAMLEKIGAWVERELAKL